MGHRPSQCPDLYTPLKDGFQGGGGGGGGGHSHDDDDEGVGTGMNHTGESNNKDIVSTHPHMSCGFRKINKKLT